MKKVIFVMGLQGVGKSRWIAENYPAATVIDIEYWWENKPLDMDKYELATYTKLMTQAHLIHALNQECDPIIVEISGMTKASQAGIRAMIVECILKGYKVELYYLKPSDMSEFLETLEGNQNALDMFRDYSFGGPQWRDPPQCPYFPKGEKVLIDHSNWEQPDTPATFTVERTD